MADGVDVLGITSLALLADLSATTNGCSCQRRLLSQGPSLLSTSVALGDLQALLLVLLLGCYLLLQKHHLVLLLVELVQLCTVSVHVEAVLDEVAVLISFLDVFQLVLWVEDLLLFCFLVLFVSCSSRCCVDLWLSLVIVKIVVLLFILSSTSLLAVVLLSFDHHGIVVLHLNHLILVVIHAVIVITLLFTLILVLIIILLS